MRQTILLLLLLPSLIPLRAQTAPRQDYALFFACETYEQNKSWKTLPGLTQECEDMARDLRDLYGFETKVVKNPTLKEIDDELARWRAKGFGPYDQLLVFFSGHGEFLADRKQGYFIPRDGKSSAVDIYERRWFSLLDLRRLVTGIPCRHILLALDACKSGALDDGLIFKNETEPWATSTKLQTAVRNTKINDRLRNQSRLFMTSGALNATLNPSPFAASFREAFATLGGVNEVLSPAELEKYLDKNVPQAQSGSFEGHELKGTFLFVYQPKSTPTPTPTPIPPTAASDYDDDGTPDKDDQCPIDPGPANTKGCPDGDRDGVADKLDQCPTVAGTAANNGCPPDTDKDGILDKDDKCPTEPGPISSKGCPDGDGDGVADKSDQCPTVAGTTANNGCPPDIDKDGTLDKDDKCPTEPGPINTKGCPDGDGDGVADKFDQCPTVAGTIANTGCPPDTDKDGISDRDDKCPTEPGTIITKGCPDGDGDGVADKFDQCPTVVGITTNNGCPPSFDAKPIPSPVTHRRKSGLIMIPVEGGTYLMGSPTNDPDHQNDECLHSVTVKTFAIAQYELTQADWREVMGSDPLHLAFRDCDECPVENVSWDDIQEFLKKANDKYGRRFRLPTEEEWEYAAKGGNKRKGYTYAGSYLLKAVAWCSRNSDSKTHPVGQKAPNELGLYDMCGNVWEWCQDFWGPYSGCSEPKERDESRRVLRGGAWNLFRDCRPALRDWKISNTRYYDLGFRLAQD